MYRKASKGWLKHGDFILLDIIVLQLSYFITYRILTGNSHPYQSYNSRFQALILVLGELLTILFTQNYKNILRRGKLEETLHVCSYISECMVISLVILFAMHQTGIVSRLQYGITAVLFVIIAVPVRLLNKERVLRSRPRHERSLVLVTSSRIADEAIEKLTKGKAFRDYVLSGVILLDETDENGFVEKIKKQYGIRAGLLTPKTIGEVTRGWVDEVFILQPHESLIPLDFMKSLMDMGITVSFSMDVFSEWAVNDIQKIGPYKVLVNSMSAVTPGAYAVKRAVDILGGIVGCIITGILYLFIAPRIRRESPGPIFFKQERVGRNGKTFKMYKFRSMYMDAEERKQKLMKENKISGGMMFKLDDDPRIIGSEKKDKNGKPAGIGNFIRNTSIDEFPQFFNVLIGNMSLVGTRPPTLDEWSKYEPAHRARMSVKPGITGMWQVSGRSDITDFDEVVRLDREYIENWSLTLDLKIILKTIVVVLTRRGAE